MEIEITNEKKNSIPSSKNIDDYISNHYSLRDVCSSNNREVGLYFSEPDNKGLLSTTILLYSYPKGKLVYNKEEKLNGDTAHFRIYESEEQLTTSSKLQGTAGLLIKTEGAILDNKLFGYETDPAGLYFYGEIICPGIAKSIRSGDESIVDFNRGGLDWRHEHNKKLESLSKKILKQLVESKRNKIASEKRQQVKEPIQKMLDKLCKEMSKLAKEELEEPGPAPGQLNSLIILPMVANINPDEPRQLGVYAPKYLTEEEGTKIVSLTSTKDDIRVLNSEIKLDFYKKDENIFRTSFKVVGHTEGETGIITAKLGKQTASCELRVAKQKTKKAHKRKRKTGGIFNKIIPAHDSDPIQRYDYLEGGIIKVFVKFPGVAEYLGDNFENVHTTEGKAILSEIILEAFCRHIARKQAGIYFDEDIDHLLSEMDRLRRKASHIIYELVFKSDLSELIGN